MRIKQTWTFAVAAALFVSATPNPARADDPVRSSPKATITREDLAEQDKKLYKEHQNAIQELKRNPHLLAAGPWIQRSQEIQVKAHDMEIRLEDFVDGAILYSMPVGPKELEAVLKFGQYRKINRKEDIANRVVFQDRIYRIMRARGSEKDWRAMIGRDVVVTTQTQGGMQQALSVRVKK